MRTMIFSSVHTGSIARVFSILTVFPVPRLSMCVGLALLALWSSPSTPARAAPGVAPTEALRPEEQIKRFHLPPGFEIQLVVADPDIGQPMNLNFDARGRLWITHSIEYPYPARGDVEPRNRFPGQGDHDPRDRLTVVEGIGPDGRPARITHFAGGLNIPIGTTPLLDGRSALVFSIPNISRVVDTNGDGTADERSVLYGKFGNIDTHGMASSFRPWIDGWIYGCHGFANTSSVQDGSGRTTQMNSGNTYRFRADGSRFEQFTWGQVNPFGMAFDPWGNVFDSDCHSMPIYLLLRGAYYPSFGKPHDGLGFGPTMIDHGHGSTGICGPAYYAASQFPEDHRGSVYICNPVNCVVHHDRLKQVGSTFLIDTQPDLVTCDDGWFRPVDLTVGPDGALYIADFYNCIIGHYEVPLDHPRRDRTHGRVWRIVYTGKDRQSVPGPRDLVALSTEQLVAELGSPSLTTRVLATNWLVDQLETLAAEPRAAARDRIVAAVQTAMAAPAASAELRAHGLWVLERLAALAPEAVQKLARDASPLVRTHVLRALTERPDWTPEDARLVQDRLMDDDAMVRRVAAEALSTHPRLENIDLLFQLLAATPAEDTHLVHMTRIAVRNQLRDDTVLAALDGTRIPEPRLRHLVELAVSIPTEASANLVVQYLDRFGGSDPRAGEYVAFAGQHASAERLTQLASLIRTRNADNLEYQVQQLESIQTGLQRRGSTLNPVILDWARDLTAKLLAIPQPPGIPWHSHPAAGAAVPGDPWVLQKRPSADGNPDATFWSSLPRGERLMGTLRSGPFQVPARLRFFCAGHNGLTSQPEQPRNFIRLLDAATGEVLAEAKPPRNDLAQLTEWDLTKFAGRQGALELIDGFDASGYAWLAVGRFSLDGLNPGSFRPFAAAMDLITRFHLTDFRPVLEQTVRDSALARSQRRQAAEALTSLAPDSRLSAVLMSVSDHSDPALCERALAVALTRDDKELGEVLGLAMLQAPRETQRVLAEQLCSDRAGAEALLSLTGTGKASPRLLTDPALRNRLAALKLDRFDERITELTRQLPDENAQLLKLIEERRNQFNATTADSTRGVLLFEKNCGVCHQIAGKGQKVGPQLDGIGARGMARLVEDILDPNRNVDPAFRSTVLELTDGRVVIGLIRRTEGETLILADGKGKEFTVPKNLIEEQHLSSLSLMPANLAETLTPDEFQHLVAFLLTQQTKPAE